MKGPEDAKQTTGMHVQREELRISCDSAYVFKDFCLFLSQGNGCEFRFVSRCGITGTFLRDSSCAILGCDKRPPKLEPSNAIRNDKEFGTDWELDSRQGNHGGPTDPNTGMMGA